MVERNAGFAGATAIPVPSANSNRDFPLLLLLFFFIRQGTALGNLVVFWNVYCGYLRVSAEREMLFTSTSSKRDFTNMRRRFRTQEARAGAVPIMRVAWPPSVRSVCFIET